MPPAKARGPRRAGSRRRSTFHAKNVAGTVEVLESGSLETAERIQRLVDRAQNNATIAAVIPPMEEAEKRLFVDQGQGKWKKKSDGSPATLVDTGKLRDSLTDSHAKGAIRKPLKHGTQLSFGSRTVQGVMQKRRGRDALAIDDKGRDDIVTAITNQLLG